jgi:hypothetical protein
VTADCASVAPLLEELALGALSGDERATAMAHVESCTSCSSAVAQLSVAADQLLHLAPAIEPPPGFEARAFERMGLRRVRRHWRKPLAIAAAVVAFAGGWFAGHTGAGSTGETLEKTALVSSGRTVGNVLVYASNPTWVFMYMDDPAWTGALRCQLVEEQGPVLTLGEFWLSGGRGAWAASVQQPAGRIREARVVNSAGRVLAVALMKS